jgi:hypothetical protein
MIVRSEDFIPRTHPVLLEPDLPVEIKIFLKQGGMAEPMNRMECCDVDDDCFHCGEKLTTPYLYWQGAPKSVSLHQKCALKVALGLIQDAHELTKDKPSESERDAAAWLDLYASKKEYGIEDEELRLS